MKTVNSILLIDDDEVSNFIVTRLIHKMGIEEIFKFIPSAEESLIYIKSHPLVLSGIIFIDIHLPFMNGIEFLQEIKRQHPDFSVASVIPVCSIYHPVDKQDLFKLGITECILKPVTIDKLEKHLGLFQEKQIKNSSSGQS